jgi:hypothetical protein
MAERILFQFSVGLVNVALLFNLHDLWAGIFWKSEVIPNDDTGGEWHEYTIYIELLPALPVRIQWSVAA